MSDSIYDPSQHTTTNEALELSDNALRDALSTDVYGTSTEFKVRVLTLPVPIGQLAESAAVRFIRSGNTNRAVSGSVPLESQRFSFKGRIVGEPGRPSPHERFLPDPCAISLSTNRLRYATICMLHTTFKSPAGYNGPVPRVGDLVTVTLDAGSIGPFNLQASEFQSLRQKKNPTNNALEQEVECRTLLKQDWAGQRQSGRIRPGSLPVTEEEKIPPSFTVRIPMTGRYSSGYDLNRLNPKDGVRRPHYGIDIAAGAGTPIIAIADGFVYDKGGRDSQPGGYWIRTAHPFSTDPSEPNKFDKMVITFSCHLKQPATLSKKTRITQGSTVALCGNTGRSTGNHLHFEALVVPVEKEWFNTNGTPKTAHWNTIKRLWSKHRRKRKDPIQVCRWDKHFANCSTHGSSCRVANTMTSCMANCPPSDTPVTEPAVVVVTPRPERARPPESQPKSPSPPPSVDPPTETPDEADDDTGHLELGGVTGPF